MNEPIHIISLGAGVQSSTMALMAAEGTLGTKVDFAVFADTGDEPDEVYDWLATLKRLLPFKVITAKSHHGSLSQNLFKWGFSQIPCFSRNRKTNEPGKGKRQCTNHWKIRPINRSIKVELGLFRKRIQPGIIHVLKGISIDEVSRAKPSREKWETTEFPLLDKNISRSGCVAWLDKRGHSAPKSACFFCPLKDQEAWARVSENPKLWAKTIAIDRQLNERGEYLHPSCEPIESKPFLKHAKNDRQLNLWNNECEGMCGV